MGSAQIDNELESWSVDGFPLRIEYPAAVLKQICAAAVDGLTKFRHGGVEVGGVLYGKQEKEALRVLEFRPLECEYAYGPRFLLSDRDRAKLKELVSAPQKDSQLRGLEVVGWYHSHTRGGLGLTPRDVEISERFFRDTRWQLSVVILPRQEGASRVGFFFREAGNKVRGGQFEVQVVPNGAPAAAESSPEAGSEFPPVATVHTTRQSAEPPPAAYAPPPEPLRDAAPVWERVPATPARPAALPEPQPATTAMTPAPRRSPAAPSAPAVVAAPQFSGGLASFEVRRGAPKWPWIVIPLLLVLAAGTGVFWWWHVTASQRIALWLADINGQLMIEWDRNAPLLMESSGGVLDIVDGGQRTAMEMDAQRIREGSVEYVRHSDNIDVRLRVFGGGGTLVDELVRFIGTPVQPGGLDLIIRERDELKLEVDKLREELLRAKPPAPAPAKLPSVSGVKPSQAEARASEQRAAKKTPPPRPATGALDPLR